MSEQALDQQTFSAMKTLMGDTLGEFIDVYLGTAPAQFDELRTATQKGDADEVVRTAHQIKGSSGSIGAIQVARIAERLETIGNTGSLDTCPSLVDELIFEFSRVEQALLKKRSE